MRPGTRTKLYRTALCTDIDTNCPGKRAEKNFSRYMAPTIPGQFFSAFSHNYKKTFISADDPYVCRKLEQYREKKERESCGSHMGPAYDAAREHILRLHQLAGEFISEADKLSREIDSWETER